MIWSYSRPIGSLALSLFLLSPLSCASDGTNTATDQGQGSPDMSKTVSEGPQIISFGTNVSSLTDGETVRFVAVVTDTSGVDKLVGGQLTSPDGAIKYGAFLASQQGSYSLDLTWAQISQTKLIAFATEEKRQFVGEFYDIAGRKTTQSIELRFHCNTDPACEGRCTPTGNVCATTKDKLCVAGACQSGCYVNKAFVAADAGAMGNSCMVCKPMTSMTALQTQPDYSACMTGLTCGAGKCEVPFARQDSKATSTLYGVTAASSMVQVAVGSVGTVVYTSDGGTTWKVGNSGVTNTLRNAYAASATEIYAAGFTGTVIKSTDGGANWVKLPMPAGSTTTSFYGIWGSSGTDIWVVGDLGTVLHSVNNGTSWTKLATGSSAYFNTVWGSGPNDVYVMGDTGAAIRTTNGGTSFTTLNLGVTSSIYDIWGSSATDVYAVGFTGTVLRSTNNGTSWTKLTTPTTRDIYSVWGSGANNVYIAGATGQLLRTTDSSTLTVVPTATTGTLYHLSGTAANEITIVGSNYPNVLRKL